MSGVLEEVLRGGDVNAAVPEVAKTDKFAFWNAWLAAAVAHPMGQPRLIELGKALKAADAALPELGWALRETFEIYDKPTEEFVRLNAMYARIAQAGIADTLAYAVVVFRGTLESEAEPDMYRLRALEMWVAFAGRELYNGGQPHHADSALCRGGPLWHGEGGISQARWEFWEQRAQNVGVPIARVMELVRSS